MARTREQTQAARESKLDELHERLTGAVEQLVTGDDWRRALAFAARFRVESSRVVYDGVGECVVLK